MRADYKHSTRYAGIGRGALTALVIRRATDISPAAALEWPDSKIVSLIVGDLNRAVIPIVVATDLAAFIDIAGIITLLLVFLGTAALPGIGLVVLLVCVVSQL